jgi:hypothetical protein
MLLGRMYDIPSPLAAINKPYLITHGDWLDDSRWTPVTNLGIRSQPDSGVRMLIGPVITFMINKLTNLLLRAHRSCW